MPQLKLRTFLKEYSGGTLHFNSIKFQVIVHLDGMYCKIQYIPKTSNELVKLNNVYGKENIAKKIKEHLQKRLGVDVNFGNSNDAGLSFTILTGNIEAHILTMIQ